MLVGVSVAYICLEFWGLRSGSRNLDWGEEWNIQIGGIGPISPHRGGVGEFFARNGVYFKTRLHQKNVFSA